MSIPLHTRARRAVRSALLRALVASLGWMPLGLAWRVGGALGRLAFLLVRGERRRAEMHLALAFPEKPERERRQIARGSFVHLGRAAMETVVLRRRLAPRLASYVSLSPGSEEVVRRAVARGRGVVFAAGHLGHWELLAQRLALLAQPAGVIARRSRMPWVDAAIGRIRSEGQLATLWRDDPATGARLIRLFRAGGSLGILINQDTRVQGVFVPFFGRPAFTPRAAGDLALRFGAPVLFVASHRRGPGPGDGHEVEVREVLRASSAAGREEEVLRLTAEVVQLQEEAIRRHPEEWVWMHKRWRSQPSAASAPLSAKAAQANTVPKSREVSST